MSIEYLKSIYPNAVHITKENAKEAILSSVRAFEVAKKISQLYYDKWLAEHQTELGEIERFDTPEEYIKAVKDNLMTEEGRKEILHILSKIITESKVEEFRTRAMECKEGIAKLNSNNDGL